MANETFIAVTVATCFSDEVSMYREPLLRFWTTGVMKAIRIPIYTTARTILLASLSCRCCEASLSLAQDKDKSQSNRIRTNMGTQTPSIICMSLKMSDARLSPTEVARMMANPYRMRFRLRGWVIMAVARYIMTYPEPNCMK